MEKIKFLDQDKIEDIFSATRIYKYEFTTRDYAMLQIGYFCGLRISEVPILTWTDFLPRTKSIYCTRLKNGKSGSVRLLEKHVRLLQLWMDESKYNLPHDPIFSSRRGTPLSRSRIHKIFQKVAADAHIRKDFRHFHVLRHSIAVHLLDSGADLSDVQEHLGHKRIANTLIYAKYTSIRKKRFNQIIQSSRFIAK